MHAVRIHEFGGPEVLKFENLPDPEPGPGEVLVEVRASSVNPVDYKIRNGGYLAADKLPLTLGRDISGLVRRCGAGERSFEPGQAIYAMLPPDRGGHVEQVCIPEAVCARKPERLDFVQAAAVPLAALTAWQGLFDHGRLEQGQLVLIHGGAGGVGHFAVQVGKAMGAAVTATCGPSNVEFVRSLGADRVIDYSRADFTRMPDRYDVIFDAVAMSSFAACRDRLEPGGAYVTTLPERSTLLFAPVLAAARLFGRAKRAKFIWVRPEASDLAFLGGLAEKGKLKPEIARTFPLEQAREAHDLSEQGHVRGKIVLE